MIVVCVSTAVAFLSLKIIFGIATLETIEKTDVTVTVVDRSFKPGYGGLFAKSDEYNVTFEYDGQKVTVDKREFYEEYEVGDEILADIKITICEIGFLNKCEITPVIGKIENCFE